MAASPEWRLSGGAANADPDASLGGAESSTKVGTNGVGAGLAIFDDVSGDETSAGDVEYRAVFVHNAGDQPLQAPKLWISSAPTDADVSVAIALADEGVAATIESVANENTAPSGPAFSSPTTKAGGLALPDIPAGSAHGIWVRRTVAAASSADSDAWTLRVEGDTAA